MKIKKKQLLKMIRKANRELAREFLHHGRPGAHKTEKDRPRKRIRKQDIEE